MLEISIHAPPTGSDQLQRKAVYDVTIISIHAPLTGSDTLSFMTDNFLDISIHAPLTGSDQ